MTRLLTAAALGAFGLLLLPPAAPAAARPIGPASNVPGGWAATATQQIVPLRAADLGRVSAAMPMHIVVGLRMRDRAGAELVVRRQNTRGDALFGRALTPGEFAARFNPTRGQTDTVARYLVSHGFGNVRVQPNNLLVTGDAPAMAVESAFKTQIHWFRRTSGPGTKQFYANVAPALVPAQLKDTVLGVLGLHNFGMSAFLRKPGPGTASRIAARLRDAARHAAANPDAKPTAQPCLLPPANGVCSREYGLYDFQAAYGALKQPTANHTSIAIFATGDVSQVPIDLATYRQSFNAKGHFPVSIVLVGTASTDTSGLDEFDMDTQVSTALAGKVKHLYIYDSTSLSDADTALGFNQFVADRIAQAGSASFGEPEAVAYADGAMVIDDQIFNQAAAQGQTVFASSGDNGAACPVIIATGVPFVPGVVGVCYPAVSPYVVGVGGTSLVTDQNTSAYGGEIGWQGTGGGQSAFELPASWTKPVVPAALSVDGTERTVPDIAMDADNNVSPAIVVVNGAAVGIGGTSLSSPLALGAWARLLSAHPGAFGSNAPFGFALPALYYEYTLFPYPTPPPPPTGPPGFETGVIGGYHDIEFGDNGLWTGLPAYDLMTGMGTLDVGVQMTDIALPGSP